MSQPTETYPYLETKKPLKLTVGVFTTDTGGISPRISPIQPIPPIPLTTVPVLVSHKDVLQFFFPTTFDIYLYDGSGSIVNLNSTVYSSLSAGHLFFLQNSYISNSALAKSIVTSLVRLS